VRGCRDYKERSRRPTPPCKSPSAITVGAVGKLDLHIRETRKAACLAPNLPDKLECQRALRRLEAQRDEAWRSYDGASREIDRQKDALLDEISRRLQQQTAQELLFILRWCLV